MNPKRPYDNTARAAKAEATKNRIRRCAAELYCRRTIADITLEAVAERAETSVQTILRAFGSKDALLVEALYDLAAPEGTPVMNSEPGDVPAMVSQMFDLYEAIGDHVIRRLADAQRFPALERGNEVGRKDHQAWVRRIFAPQLHDLAEPARTILFHALVATTDVYVWKVLRRDQGLARPLAEAVVRRMIIGATNGV